MKLSYIESDHWSVMANIVYSDWKRFMVSQAEVFWTYDIIVFSPLNC